MIGKIPDLLQKVGHVFGAHKKGNHSGANLGPFRLKPVTVCDFNIIPLSLANFFIRLSIDSRNDSGFMETRSSMAMQMLARRASFYNSNNTKDSIKFALKASASNSPYSSAE